jgi:hypothetical protein
LNSGCARRSEHSAGDATYPPGCGLIYFWREYEMQRPEHDEKLAQNEDGASAVESATP